jgi:hypothetical protein
MTSKWQEAKARFQTAEQSAQILCLLDRVEKLEKVVKEMLRPESHKMTAAERCAKARAAKAAKNG